MGDNEEYELGVRNGQRGGFLDDFSQSLVNTGSAYDKGYEYGIDHRRDSSGERYHTWDNQGKNDLKETNTSSPDIFSSWFGGSGKNSSESKTESSGGGGSWTGGSGGGGGGGGGYSGGGGSGGGGIEGGKGCLGCLGIIGIGILCLALGRGMLNETKNLKNKERTTVQISLEENVRRLSQYLKNTNELEGNFDDYQFIPPRKFGNSESEYELGFVGPRCFYVFHSSDNGRTWAPQPPLDPYFIKLAQDYEEDIRKKWELGNVPCASPPVLTPSSQLTSENVFKKSGLNEVIDNMPGVSSYELIRTSSTSLDYSIPKTEIDPRILLSLRRFVEPSDIIDLHDGRVAVRIGESSYYKVGLYELEIMDGIYKDYEQKFENALYKGNRYRSRKMLEDCIKKNLKHELRRVVIRCERIEDDYDLTMR